MPTKALSEETKKKIAAMLVEGRSQSDIGKTLGISQAVVSKYKVMHDLPAGGPKTAGDQPQLHSAILQQLKKGVPLSDGELADILDIGPTRISKALADMAERGTMLHVTPDGKTCLADSITLPPGEGEAKGEEGEWTHRFGFTTDNHLCNKHSRLDVLNGAYAHFEREGIAIVYNAGNWIDGEARFNRTELLTAPGIDNQMDYLIDKWPVHKGIVTHFIAGDDHEGWYQQREGLQVGKYLQRRAEDQKRYDLKYLGYGEADVKLIYGSGSAVMRVVHPGGGSAYAISYTDQKRVESYQGGEKPQIELVGHYHKFNHGFPREVHTIQGGCTCDQTMFMRKKRIQAHVGYSIIKVKQNEQGIVTRVSVEWFPFFDRGFYEKRF